MSGDLGKAVECIELSPCLIVRKGEYIDAERTTFTLYV
jgi:hypothetical protein